MWSKVDHLNNWLKFDKLKSINGLDIYILCNYLLEINKFFTLWNFFATNRIIVVCNYTKIIEEVDQSDNRSI